MLPFGGLFLCLPRSAMCSNDSRYWHDLFRFAYHGPIMSLPDRVKIWLTSVNPFFPIFCPNVNHPLLIWAYESSLINYGRMIKWMKLPQTGVNISVKCIHYRRFLNYCLFSAIIDSLLNASMLIFILIFIPNFPLGLVHEFLLADRTNGRAIATLLRLSVVVCRLSVCDVMYCG